VQVRWKTSARWMGQATWWNAPTAAANAAAGFDEPVIPRPMTMWVAPAKAATWGVAPRAWSLALAPGKWMPGVTMRLPHSAWPGARPEPALMVRGRFQGAPCL